MTTYKATGSFDAGGTFSLEADIPVAASPPPPPVSPPPPPPVSPPPPAGYQLGQVPFAPSSPWNKTVPASSSFGALAWPKPTGYNYSIAWDSYSPGVYISQAGDPLVQVAYPQGWGYPGGTVGVHLKSGISGAAGTDGEIVIVDGTTVYNFWQFARTGDGSATAQSYGKCDVARDSGWGSASPFLGAGIRAAACSELGGLIIQAETDAGDIHHALALVVDSPLAKSGFVAPAIAGDGGSSTGIVIEGQWLAIPPTATMPAGLTDPLAQKIFRAVQKYGCYVTDKGAGNCHFCAQANGYGNGSAIASSWAQMQYVIPLLKRVS